MCFLPLIKMPFHKLWLLTLNDNENEKKNVGKGRRKPACQLANVHVLGFNGKMHILDQKAHTMSEINNFMCFKGQTAREMFNFMKVSDSWYWVSKL